MPPNAICKPHTRQWHKERNNGIGASEIAAAVGLSQYEQPLSVWLRKSAAREKGAKPITREETIQMRIGSALEDVIKDEFEREHGPLLNRNPMMYRAWEGSYLFATPDGIVDSQTLLECKTCGQYGEDKWGESGSDVIPAEYYAQVQFQMGVMECWSCWVAVLFKRTDEVRFYKIQRNQELINRLFFAAKLFWEMVETGKEPPVDWAHRSTPELVKALTTTVEPTRCQLSQGWADEWAEYEKLGEYESKIKERREWLKSRVTYAIGDFGGGVLPDGRMIERRMVERKGYTVKPSSYPQLYVKKQADGQPIVAEITYVAVDEAKQPTRIGFAGDDAPSEQPEHVAADGPWEV